MNMSYCQFENTSTDLSQLLSVLSEAVNNKSGQLKLSDSEKRAYQILIQQCEDFLQLSENIYLVDEIDEEGEEE